MDDGTTRAVIVVCDLVGLDGVISAAARRRDRCGAWVRHGGLHAHALRPGYDHSACGYDPTAFGGRDRAWFLQALNAGGIPCMEGYVPLYELPAIRGGNHLRSIHLS